jgi:hypothetical protein
MPSRGLHEIEFFSDLIISEAAVPIGQGKVIARHGLSQRPPAHHVPKLATCPTKAPRPADARKLRPGHEIGRGEPHKDGQPEETRAGERDDERAALAKLHEDRGYEQRNGPKMLTPVMRRMAAGITDAVVGRG